MTEQVNGTASSEIAAVTSDAIVAVNGDARGSEISNRTPWLRLAAPFDNLEVRTWLDYPKEVALLWTPVEDETVEEVQERVSKACKRIFLAHRGLDGKPWKLGGQVLPGCDTDEFWEKIPNSLVAEIIRRWQEEMKESPTSRESRRARRRS